MNHTIPSSTRSAAGMVAVIAVAALAGCSAAPVQTPSAGHLRADETRAAPANIPAPVQNTVSLAAPKAAPRVETYSVVVKDVRVQELLFALARDAKLNVDIHPGIEGTVTLNAIDQTLQQILDRITKQVPLRLEIDGPNLSVLPDKPFLKTYKIDFLNMSRDVQSIISTNTQITSGGASTGSTGGASASGGNSASTLIKSDTKNNLLESLIDNVTKMLLEEDRLRYRAQVDLATSNQASAQGTGQIATDANLGKQTTNRDGTTNQSGPGSSTSGSGNQAIQSQGAAAAKVGTYEQSVSVFANRETGVLIVRATSRQHEKVQEFIDRVMVTAKRQVLIEATIVEVRLNDNYKQGINWSALRLGAKGFELSQAGTAGLPSANPLNIFTLAYANPTSVIGNLAAQISLLESFGNVKVLSSPKLSVMNNQTATLKVADNKVYFTVKADTTTSNGIASTTFTTTPNQVSVGFIMNVTPQVSDANAVTINVRPTITRIIGYVNDPNPSLANANVINRVPEIQTREMESIIKVDSGEIAVMGGLMQDEINNLTDDVPGLGGIPVIGNFFRNRNDTSTKSELVIFIKPTIIQDASVAGDYRSLAGKLPNKDFFANNPGPKPPHIEVDGGQAR